MHHAHRPPVVGWILRSAICLLVVAWATPAAKAQENDLSTGTPPGQFDIDFASGVLTTIDPDLRVADTVSRHDVVELRAMSELEREPALSSSSRTLYEMAEDVPFRRDVWCLEFSFKPLRMIHVDIPQANGRMQRKLLWYMVYRVRNTGAGLAPEEQEDGTFTTVERQAEPQRFIPQFVLASKDLDMQGRPLRKSYLDRIIPVAVEAIQQREVRGNKLLNSVEMAELMLDPIAARAVGGAWGVAVWEDVDPVIDFFSIYVGGLTNAYRWQDAEEFPEGASPGTGRTFQRRMLQLKFWRPGDTEDETEEEIRYGPALGRAADYGTEEGVAYQWVFR
jgi:hypothetical protein